MGADRARADLKRLPAKIRVFRQLLDLKHEYARIARYYVIRPWCAGLWDRGRAGGAVRRVAAVEIFEGNPPTLRNFVADRGFAE